MKLHIDIMRHANAEKREGVSDFARPLSPKGFEQAMALRAMYNGESDKIKLVIHSPSPRVLITASLAVGTAQPKFICLDELWVNEDDRVHDGPLLWEAFERYGYDLEKYFGDPYVLHALNEFGRRVGEDINDLIDSNNLRDGMICIIAGHAIFSNFTGYHLSIGNPNGDIFFTTPFKEAGVIRMTFEDDILVSITPLN